MGVAQSTTLAAQSTALIELTQHQGFTKHEVTSTSRTRLELLSRSLVFAKGLQHLTQLCTLDLMFNCFATLPSGVCVVSTLRSLDVSNNRLTTLSDDVSQLVNLRCLRANHNRLTSLPPLGITALRVLELFHNVIADVPASLGDLHCLTHLVLHTNAIARVPASLARLRSVRVVDFRLCRLEFVPIELDRLPHDTIVGLSGNDALGVREVDARARLRDLSACSTQLGAIRESATTLCIGLQDLELPVLVTLEIVDAAFPNAIRMAAKWDLIAAVKHFTSPS